MVGLQHPTARRAAPRNAPSSGAVQGFPVGRNDTLTITEEVLLLILDSEKGDLRSSLLPHDRDIVVAGATLTDLALHNRIDTDLERLVVVDATPLGDELLDPILSEIAREADSHDATFWLERISGQGEEIRQTVVERLVGRGILESEASGLVYLSHPVSRARRYPTAGGKTTEEVQFRIMRTIFSEDIPDPRDVVIISLAAAGGVFESILSREELAGVRERIDTIARLDLIGREVASAMRQVEPAAPDVATTRSHEEIPQVRGWPIAGNAFAMTGDVREFLARQYRRHGPVFRVRAFNQRFIAFAGPEAMVHLTKIGSSHLRTYELWGNFCSAVGSMHIILSMDGPEHLRMRKVQANAYSPKFIESRLDDFADVTRRAIAEWPRDRPISLQPALQGIIAEQMGLSLTGMSARDHLDDLTIFLETLLKVRVLRQWPKQVEYWPRFRRARKRIEALYESLLDAHRPENRRGKEPDFIDDLLELHRTDPQYLPETDHLLAFLGPFLAGLDTSASACSYMIYALLQHPSLLERVRDEVDATFDGGTLTPKRMRELDVTHRVALETLRMYPIAPAATRVVTNSFEFAGFRIPAGARVLIGFTVGHHLPECFPEPGRFDIERYRRGAPEHRQPGAYAPFGLGRHRCLGSGFAEVQIALTVATIVRELDLALERPDQPLRIKHTPIAQPDPSLRIRVAGRRAGDEARSAT